MKSPKKIRLIIYEVREALSFPAVMDVVLYNDEDKNVYRVWHITVPKSSEKEKTPGLAFYRLICLGHYAPETINGVVEFENAHCLKIRTENGYRYKMLKDAEKFKFLYIDDKPELVSDKNMNCTVVVNK